MTRFRLRTGPLALFGAVFVAALLLLLPLRLMLGWFDLDRTGLAAREATGSIWFGTIRETRVGRIALGDLNAGLSPWPLFAGRARIDLAAAGSDARTLRGAIGVSRHGIGIDDVTAAGLPTADTFAPLPVSALDLDDVSVRFVDGHCERAEGRVRATLGGDLGGIVLGQGLSGMARCDAGALLLPLSSQAGTERVALRVSDGGRYRADLTVRPTDPVAAQKLELAGFHAAPAGHVLTIEGRF